MTVGDLVKYKDTCYSALSRDLTEFEKNFLLIATGMLAFTITFIKDIIRIDRASWLELLFCSWFSIILSIALMMWAFLKSANSSNDLSKVVNDYQVKNKLYKQAELISEELWFQIKAAVDRKLDGYKISLKIIRNSAVVFFLLGITSLSIFVAHNINIENKVNQGNIQTKSLLTDTLIYKLLNK